MTTDNLRTNESQDALETYTSVMTDPIVVNSRWFAEMVGNRMDKARETLPDDVYLATERRGREGDVFDVLCRVAQELAFERE